MMMIDIFRRGLLLTAALFLFMAAPSALAQSEPPDASAAAQARALVEVLQDDTARQALISELERIASPAATTEGETVAEILDVPEENAISLGRRLALLSQETAQTVADSLSVLGARLMDLPNTLAALDTAQNVGVLWEAFQNLLLVIIATYALFILLRRLARPLYRAMGHSASEVGALRTAFLIAGSTVIDALIVIVAWASGYAVTTLLFGEYGEIGIRQTLYLNAFLVVEMVKVVLRFILSPTTGDLRLIAIGDMAARYLNRWLTVIITILGFGQLLIVPIINQQVSFLAGQAMSALLSLICLLIALALVLRNRRRVADWLTNEAAHPGQPGLLRFLARRWHWPVMIYLAALFLIVVARPDGMLFPVLVASGKIILAILLGMIATGVITRGISAGVTLPSNVSRRLPLLERRLNRFVPKTLMVIRVLVVFVVVAITVNVLGMLDIEAWLESRFGADLAARIVATAMIVLVGFLVWLALTSWVDYRMNPEYGSVPTARETTLLSLLRNAATIAIFVITLMFALSEIGIDIAPLLASAGVLGLAIGFGAQKLVQDIITGVFIQFESAINVGDVITVGGTTGTVERLTIRSVSLRDLHGVYHIIPFSSVDMVSNFMRSFAYFVCDMGVAYRENTDEVRKAMMDAFDELAKDKTMASDFLGTMDWMGVTSFGDNAVNVRTRLKVAPGKQWGIGRAYNAIVKRIFDERGIEMPFPHRTLYFGEDKDGNAPAARVAVDLPEKGKADASAVSAPSHPARRIDTPPGEDEVT